MLYDFQIFMMVFNFRLPALFLRRAQLIDFFKEKDNLILKRFLRAFGLPHW